jgi:hypothetical protein
MKPRAGGPRGVPEVLERLRAALRSRGQPADTIYSKAELDAPCRARPAPSPPAASASTPRCWPPARSCARCATWRWATTTSTSTPARARRAGHQHARRADRDHGRLRLRADDGHRAPHGRERTFPAPRRMDEAGPTTCSPAADVHGATLGILGMGRIGQAIARRGALGFGMKVIYHNRSRLPASRRRRSARATSTRPRCCARPTTWCWWCRIRPPATMPSARPNWRR